MRGGPRAPKAYYPDGDDRLFNVRQPNWDTELTLNDLQTVALLFGFKSVDALLDWYAVTCANTTPGARAGSNTPVLGLGNSLTSGYGGQSGRSASSQVRRPAEA